MTQVKSPKKLIEVALPLDAINAASSKEKSLRNGHPSTLHLWWARRPLASARAVIFAQMVNDPGGERGYFAGMTKAQAAVKREELFRIIEDLVKWENTSNEEVLSRARAAIWDSWRETCRLNKTHPQASSLFDPTQLPAFHDPFAGGGALPLEAQRLGLSSFASDLNPVAATINMAMVDLPARFASVGPVAPLPLKERQSSLHNDWSGLRGLAEDVRRYGAWMREEAKQRVGAAYPDIEVTQRDAKGRPDLQHLVGKKLTVIAWLWARTVKSPNPAFSSVEVPLVSTFALSARSGSEAYIDPVMEPNGYEFIVRTGTPADPVKTRSGTKAGSSGSSFLCLMSGTPMSFDYLRDEAKAGRMGSKLMAIVADGPDGRVYLSPTTDHEMIALSPRTSDVADTELPKQALGFRVQEYGMTKWKDLFTNRQLYALSTFTHLVSEAVEKAKTDAVAAGVQDDNVALEAGGTGATAYAQAIGIYLAFCCSRMADRHSSLCRWDANPSGYAPKIANTFGRHALPMVWDYCEGNPFSPSSGNLEDAVGWVVKVILTSLRASPQGSAAQADARTQSISQGKVIATDPPYYDNIGYADLSDYFYFWLRRSLRPILPNWYATVGVPKADELVATPFRHGNKKSAEVFFLDGMTGAIQGLAHQAHPSFPVTIFYAFKQAETKGDAGTHSTGWETFLEAVLRAGFSLTGTWPMRTELSNRMISSGTNALASSIVLVCRQRDEDAPTISRREFIRELNAALPDALDEMTRGGVNSPVAPVDLSQAIIGPGMGIFSKYSAVLEADGTRMSVKTALQLINRFLSEDDFDADSQFCLHWFESVGWAIGKYGEADVLARAKGTTVGGLSEAGVVSSSGGEVRLLLWSEYPTDWSPENDQRAAIWEMLHHVIRALNADGETAAGTLLARMMGKAEPIRALAYRLFTLCERKGWSEEARAYNELITSWSGVEAAANEAGPRGTQVALDI